VISGRSSGDAVRNARNIKKAISSDEDASKEARKV